MPLFIVRPRLITISNHNLGVGLDESTEINEQRDNGVPDPDPAIYNPARDPLVWRVDDPDNYGLPAYRPGDRVRTNPDYVPEEGSLVTPLARLANETNGRFALDPDGNVVRAENIYVLLADNGQGYFTVNEDNSLGAFNATSLTNPAQRSATRMRDPDVEQDQRDDKLRPNPVNPYWSVQRRTNELSFNDTRPFIRTGRFDDDRPDDQGRFGLSFTVNSNDVGDTLALLDIEASRVAFTFTRGSKTVSREVDITDLSEIDDWREYMFRDIVFERHFIFRNIPAFAHRIGIPDFQQLKVTMRNPQDVVEIGQVVFGSEIQIGRQSLAGGYTIKGLDHSSVDTDPFGVQIRVPRPATNTNTFSVEIDRTEAETANRQLIGIAGGLPNLFFQTDDVRYGDILYGFRRDYTIAPVPNKSTRSLVSGTIQGLI